MTNYIGLAVQLLESGPDIRVVKVSTSHVDVQVACEVEAKSESDYIDGMPLLTWDRSRTKLDLTEELGVAYHILSQ